MPQVQEEEPEQLANGHTNGHHNGNSNGTNGTTYLDDPASRKTSEVTDEPIIDDGPPMVAA